MYIFVRFGIIWSGMVYNGKKWYKIDKGRKIIKRVKIKVEKIIKVVYNVSSNKRVKPNENANKKHR